VVNPSDGHVVVQRIEERDSLTFASLHKELTRKVLSVVHGKGDCGATNQCRATEFPASLGSCIGVVIVATVGIVVASCCLLACGSRTPRLRPTFNTKPSRNNS
jgi:hypothetical protein